MTIQNSQYPHLILHFDVNKTLINGDTCAKKEIEESDFQVFPSFFNLLKKLKENRIGFVIILRTFGKDLAKVIEEIEKHPLGEKIQCRGKFINKELFLDGENAICKADKIFETFLTSKKHFAIEDSYQEWKMGGKLAKAGKPFMFDFSEEWPIVEKDGSFHLVRNLSLFFDDFFTGEQYKEDIINPVEISGIEKKGKDLKDDCLFKVSTELAESDIDYYLNLVNKSLIKHGYQKIGA